MSRESEARALAELDRRVAAATSALRHELDRRTPPAGHRDDLDEAPRRLDRAVPAGRGARARRRRWTVLAVAAVLVVVAGVAAAIVESRDEPATVTNAPGDAYLLPEWLPDGMTPVRALRLEDVPEATALGGEVAAYGLPDAPDPWVGPTLTVSHIVPDPATQGDETEGEAITIDGRPATVTQQDDGEWIVTWSVDGGRLQVQGRGLPREQVIAAAGSASDRPAIDAAGLPDGFAELARGPLDALVAGALGYSGGGRGLAVSYALSADAATGTPYLSIIERRGAASAVDLARLTYPDARAVAVRGRHAVLASTGDEVLVQWAEPSGLLFTIQASALSAEEVVRVAEGLRAVGQDEVDRLVSEHPIDRDGNDGASEHPIDRDGVDGATGWLAEGEYEGEPWTLQAFVTETEVRELWLHGGNNTAPLPIDDPTGLSALRVTSATFDGGVVSVFGLVESEAGSVTVEVPGRPPVAAEVHPVEGTGYSAFVAFVLESDLGQSASVVARATDGSEIARAPVASPLHCVDHPDGRSECTTAESP